MRRSLLRTQRGGLPISTELRSSPLQEAVRATEPKENFFAREIEPHLRERFESPPKK